MGVGRGYVSLLGMGVVFTVRLWTLGWRCTVERMFGESWGIRIRERSWYRRSDESAPGP